MNLAALDLKLLIVFDAVMRERSVTRAAVRLRMSQPAVSSALNRLRHLVKDTLFLRVAGGVRPTPRAEELALPIQQALRQLQYALEPPVFAPGTARRSYTIAASDHALHAGAAAAGAPGAGGGGRHPAQDHAEVQSAHPDADGFWRGRFRARRDARHAAALAPPRCSASATSASCGRTIRSPRHR